jgi:hypothetical protein
VFLGDLQHPSPDFAFSEIVTVSVSVFISVFVSGGVNKSGSIYRWRHLNLHLNFSRMILSDSDFGLSHIGICIWTVRRVARALFSSLKNSLFHDKRPCTNSTPHMVTHSLPCILPASLCFVASSRYRNTQQQQQKKDDGAAQVSRHHPLSHPLETTDQANDSSQRWQYGNSSQGDWDTASLLLIPLGLGLKNFNEEDWSALAHIF